MKDIAIFFALLGTAYCQPSIKDSVEIRDSNVFIQFRVMPDGVFKLAQMENVARSFLEATAATHMMSVLVAYADPDVAAQEAAGCEGNYRQWKHLYDDFPRLPLAAAQVISFGHDAALRLRTAEGAVQRIVLRGTDPTEFSFDGVRFEILHVSGRVRSIFEGCAPGIVEPNIYLRSATRLDQELCKRVTSWLADKLGRRHIQVEFANSHWFPCDARFPLRYPFAADEPPPSEDAFYTMPEFSCTLRCDGKLACLE